MLRFLIIYAYKVIRLLIVLMFITYFLGCVWYMLSIQQYNESVSYYSYLLLGTGNESTNYDEMIAGASWYKAFSLDDDEAYNREAWKAVVSCYFALTTLSTVGYGDLYPKAKTEMIVAVIVMLLGVAFFSYIMGAFIEILSNYKSKMGFVDKSEDLEMWITGL